MLCPKCQMFSNQAVQSGAEHDGSAFPWRTFSYDLHDSFRSLKDSVSGHCSICSSILFGLTDRESASLPDNVTTRLELQRDQNAPVLAAGIYDSSGNEVFKKRVIALFHGHADDEISELLQELSGLPNESTGSESSFKLANFWLNQCLESHTTCPKIKTTGFLPTRIIDVGCSSDDNPRLCDTRKEEVSTTHRTYVALSHCWGKAPTITTTLATLNDRLKAIPISSLPASFRDAVIATREMHVRYLWIDSLCIIQDSKADWEKESVQMCEIYKNALFTISSAHSKDSFGGLFVRRNGTRNVPFEVEFKTPGRMKRCMFLPIPRREIVWDLLDLPLYTRAWCLQEMILSPRTLIYDPDGLRWECLTLHGSESSPRGGIARHHTVMKRLQNAILASNTDHDIFEQLGEDSVMQSGIWQHVITDFTARNLTKQTDRLIAIGGVAEALQKYTSNTYIAGLWRDHLEFNLLWFIRSRSYKKGSEQISRELPRRRDALIAPTWSWACHAYPVEYEVSALTRPLCKIRSVNTTGSQHSQSGRLVIYGDIRRFRVFNEDPSFITAISRLRDSQKYFYTARNGLQSNIFRAESFLLLASSTSTRRKSCQAFRGVWWPDEVVDPEIVVTFIAIARRPQSSGPSWSSQTHQFIHTLALVPTETNDEFRRVGYAEWDSCTWFGYNCIDELPEQVQCWRRLGRSFSRIRPPTLENSHNHRHPIEHDPLSSLNSYSKAVAVNRREVTII